MDEVHGATGRDRRRAALATDRPAPAATVRLFLDADRFRLYTRTGIVLYAAIWLAIILFGHGPRDVNGRLVGGDFVLFYSAARLATGPRPSLAYAYEANYAEENSVLGEDIVHPLFFMHPPVLLVPLALLPVFPFWAALALFSLASLAAGYGAAAAFGLPRKTCAVLFFAAPAVFQCLSQGQLALFVGGLATGGLLLLPHREKWSGLLLGLSLIKPHIVAAVFFYAVLKKKWRPLFWAVLTFVLLAVLAECAFGAGMWRAFFDALWGAKRIVEHGSAPISKMTTVFAAGKLFGLGNAAAYLLQGLSAVIALAGVAYAVFVVRNVWIERASVLAACLLLPHYAYDYDWTLVLFSVFALVRAWTEAGQDMPPYLKAVTTGAYVAPLLATALSRLAGVQIAPWLLLLYFGGLLALPPKPREGSGSR